MPAHPPAPWSAKDGALACRMSPPPPKPELGDPLSIGAYGRRGSLGFHGASGGAPPSGPRPTVGFRFDADPGLVAAYAGDAE